MPSFPELLYVPADSDVAKAITLPGRFRFFFTESVANTTVGENMARVEADQVLVVTHVHLTARAGAAQLTTRVRANIADELGTTIGQLIDQPSAVQNISHSWQGEVLLMPGERLTMSGTFDAGAAANEMTYTIMGVKYPRANWQFAPTG